MADPNENTPEETGTELAELQEPDKGELLVLSDDYTGLLAVQDEQIHDLRAKFLEYQVGSWQDTERTEEARLGRRAALDVIKAVKDRRKEIMGPVSDFSAGLLEEERRVEKLLRPVVQTLDSQLKANQKAKKAVKEREAAAKREERRRRVGRLQELGAVFDPEEVAEMSETEYTALEMKAEMAFDKREQERLAKEAEERERKAELEKLRREKEELEREKQELEREKAEREAAENPEPEPTPEPAAPEPEPEPKPQEQPPMPPPIEGPAAMHAAGLFMDTLHKNLVRTLERAPRYVPNSLLDQTYLLVSDLEATLVAWGRRDG